MLEALKLSTYEINNEETLFLVLLYLRDENYHRKNLYSFLTS